MEVGLSNHLKKISSELFIKYALAEKAKVDKSFNSIIYRLEDHFGDG